MAEIVEKGHFLALTPDYLEKIKIPHREFCITTSAHIRLPNPNYMSSSRSWPVSQYSQQWQK